MVNKSYEIEYCNLDLRFDRRRIRDLISDLIEEGYSLYWNENELQFIIAVRSGRKLVKLKFDRISDRYKLVGNYSFKDLKLAELLEKMINDTKGHAVVKRFKESQILIDNIMFGEIIKTVEITGFDQKVVYEKAGTITAESVIQALRSNRVEDRLPSLRLEIDYELATLHELIELRAEADRIERCKDRLRELRQEMLLSEMI